MQRDTIVMNKLPPNYILSTCNKNWVYNYRKNANSSKYMNWQAVKGLVMSDLILNHVSDYDIFINKLATWHSKWGPCYKEN